MRGLARPGDRGPAAMPKQHKSRCLGALTHLQRWPAPPAHAETAPPPALGSRPSSAQLTLTLQAGGNESVCPSFVAAAANCFFVAAHKQDQPPERPLRARRRLARCVRRCGARWDACRRPCNGWTGACRSWRHPAPFSSQRRDIWRGPHRGAASPLRGWVGAAAAGAGPGAGTAAVGRRPRQVPAPATAGQRGRPGSGRR
jgi:hypothetical protein